MTMTREHLTQPKGVGTTPHGRCTLTIMRKCNAVSGVSVHAVAGTHVVSLGMDVSPARREGCLGFAIQREDHTEDERQWLRGLKTFAETDPGLAPGESVSSREHPFQAFQWADYSAKPDHDYTYTVVARTGKPAALKSGPAVSVRIQTESELARPHSVFFNRGAIASQEYARRFLNIAPDKLEGEAQASAYRWLSRGLLEALLGFIARASGPQFALHGAIYEFRREEVLSALRAAGARGVETHIVYDGIPKKDGAREANEKAIAAQRIKGLCEPRTVGTLMHNKFLVLSRNDTPVAVWTGSTNISENGLFGQLNVGHIVDDSTVAGAYRDYWDQLHDDLETPALRTWVGQHSPPVPVPSPSGTTSLMSPRSGLAVLDSYAKLASRANDALFMTFAFGMDKRFRAEYERDDGVLRVALMEKEGNGPALAEAKRFIAKLRKRRNVVVAVGKHKRANALDRWQQERADGIGRNVDWVHTKFMLIDPLSDDPVVVTGSANFSEKSTSSNDENMLVIHGDKRVADIYLGEFMRCFSHHAFREALTFKGGPSSHLKSDPAEWQERHFRTGDDHFLRRQYFAQTG
jgi:phosphatidylserine/phosphatidylglycerophosphate/cardiolipin synthase-like enzyme